MAYSLVRLSLITDEERYKTEAERQLDFLVKSASQYPTNHAMFLRALLEHEKPAMKITVATDETTDKRTLPLSFPPDAVVILLDASTKEYPLKNGKTTYYVCRGHSCLPPTNDPHELLKTEHS